MTRLKRIGQLAAAGAVGAALLGTTMAVAPAQAADSSRGKISCKAAKVRKNPAKNSTAKGIAYRGDKIVYDQFAYKKSERAWYTRGTVTRKSDGAKIRGYVPYGCANPYGTNPAPTPPIPK
ncbi:hypothetical protein SMD44_p10063 (plasmid) [Streptomyces alboflavus]|uniref:SH3b domain-containing protein n=1 Tax=Streptomyces alboflavus TaxID=67267 RepID=A0A291W4U0_9ACTN|nr:hypothetical protein [Streptomyces alboflavus]ATM24562.1 hypothetical protein SMD44_p10063 [Streptomyces alboflavus]